MADIIRTFDEDIPVPAAEAAQREAVAWAMTHSLADQFPGDEAASAELAVRLPTGGPTTAEAVDATLVTTSLRIPLSTQRRVQVYAETHGINPPR